MNSRNKTQQVSGLVASKKYNGDSEVMNSRDHYRPLPKLLKKHLEETARIRAEMSAIEAELEAERFKVALIYMLIISITAIAAVAVIALTFF